MGTRSVIAKRERLHWTVGDRTRCGIPLRRTRRISRYATVVSDRRAWVGAQTVQIPYFLDQLDRCRRCARLLRKDTGLLRNLDREALNS